MENIKITVLEMKRININICWSREKVEKVDFFLFFFSFLGFGANYLLLKDIALMMSLLAFNMFNYCFPSQ